MANTFCVGTLNVRGLNNNAYKKHISNLTQFMTLKESGEDMYSTGTEQVEATVF